MGFNRKKEEAMDERIEKAGEAAGAPQSDIDAVKDEANALYETGAADPEFLASKAEEAAADVLAVKADAVENVEDEAEITAGADVDFGDDEQEEEAEEAIEELLDEAAAEQNEEDNEG